jgi:hypothetical protein
MSTSITFTNTTDTVHNIHETKHEEEPTHNETGHNEQPGEQRMGRLQL